MKILRLVAIIMALTALPVQGQLEFSGRMNLSELNGALGGAGLQDAANRTGMVFGFDLILPVGGTGLDLGADWSQKGVEDIVTDPGTQQQVLRQIDLSYYPSTTAHPRAGGIGGTHHAQPRARTDVRLQNGL